MTNLFPLPHWAPAFKRVPSPLQLLDEAYARGERFANGAPLHLHAAGCARSFAEIAAPLSRKGEDVSRTQAG